MDVAETRRKSPLAAVLGDSRRNGGILGGFSSPCDNEHKGGLHFYMHRRSWPEKAREGGGGGGQWRPNLELVEGFRRGLHGEHGGGFNFPERRPVRRKLEREGGG